MKKYKNIAIVGVVLLLVGYGVGRYLQPNKVVIKKQEIIKEVGVTKKDVVVVEKETKLPDGTIIVDRRTEDKSIESVRKDTTTKESTVIVNSKPQYRVRGGFGYDFIENTPQYNVGGEKRFWGPLSLGVDATVSNNLKFKGVNATLSWEF